jgi:SAM-dependent methyltransferase
MEELYKEYVISYFDKTLCMHGDRPAAVGFSPQGQQLRFEEFLAIGDISGTRVLDYGCGKGDLYQFLRTNNIEVSYTGLDINQNMISMARSKFPECDFRVFDIEEDTLKEDFDYIFLCGVFNLKIKGLEKTIKKVLKRLFKDCKVALAFNALSAHCSKKSFELHYLDPDKMLEFAKEELSPNALVRQGRVPDDFTMFVYK